MSQDLAWRNLLKEQSWMQEAMDAANTGLWVIMIDTRNGCCSMLASAPMLRLLGLEEHPAPEECFAFWRGRVDKKCDDDVNDVVDQFLADTQLHEVRYPYHHPKWGVIFVRCGGRRISADDDPLVRITGYHQDVSEIQAMHQSLRESLARLSLACRQGQLGVFELRHGEGELELTGNDIFFGQLGLPEGLGDEERVDAVEARLVPEDREAWRALRHPEDWVVGRHEHTEVRVLHPRLGQRWLKLAYEVMGSGENRRIAGYTDDVTEHRLHERMLREAKDEAEAANAAKSIFLANMSHEIRTPMNGIIGLTHLALQSDPSPEHKDYLHKIRSSATSLLAIINDILDLSKIEANKMVLENVNYTMEEVLDFVYTSIRFPLDQKGLEYICEVADDVPLKLWGDGLRLKQVLLNLLSNAVKFTSKGSVRLRIRRENSDGQDLLHFMVTDTGMGISREYQQHLFDPYTQANASIARRFGGTGLGLSICKRIAGLMRGNLWCESEPGNGSTFHLSIPCILSRKLPGACPTVQSSLPLPGGARILLVEDNEINQEIARAMLHQLGLDCDLAQNGKEAVSMALAKDYDLLLMDVRMPIMDGLTATRLIREKLTVREKSSTLPIVAMTAATLPENIDEILDAGMDDHISKPFDATVLRNKLAYWLKRR